MQTAVVMIFLRIHFRETEWSMIFLVLYPIIMRLSQHNTRTITASNKLAGLIWVGDRALHLSGRLYWDHGVK
jgi:hypothetical protein